MERSGLYKHNCVVIVKKVCHIFCLKKVLRQFSIQTTNSKTCVKRSTAQLECYNPYKRNLRIVQKSVYRANFINYFHYFYSKNIEQMQGTRVKTDQSKLR